MKNNFKIKFKELGVSIVYLFGSRALGTSTSMSDTDIGVVLKDPTAVKDTRALYNDLYDLLAEQYPTKRLDIVFLQAAPLPLQYHAIKEGKVLFEKDPRTTSDYEAYVINMYLDFKPVLEYLDKISSTRHAHA
jgi:predicted nucleotidyltransferase